MRLPRGDNLSGADFGEGSIRPEVPLSLAIHHFVNYAIFLLDPFPCGDWKSLFGQILAHYFNINIAFSPHEGMDLTKICISKMVYFRNTLKNISCC